MARPILAILRGTGSTVLASRIHTHTHTYVHAPVETREARAHKFPGRFVTNMDPAEKERRFFLCTYTVISTDITKGRKTRRDPTIARPRPLFDQLVTAATSWILLPMAPPLVNILGLPRICAGCAVFSPRKYPGPEVVAKVEAELER